MALGGTDHEWPDIPFEILLHDPAVYAGGEVWSADVEKQWGTDEAAFAELTPQGTVHVVEGSVTGTAVRRFAQIDAFTRWRCIRRPHNWC